MRANRKPNLALFALSLLLAAGVFAQTSAPMYQVVVAVDPVSLDVSVSDRDGKAVTGLTKDDFIVLEDGQPQELQSLDPVGMPYSILVLVDRSPRDNKSPWPDFVLKSVDLFLKNLRGPDRLAVAAFDTRVAVLVDWRPSRNGTLQKVMLRHSQQPTKFFEAVDWAAEEMQYVPASDARQPARFAGRKGVVVFTDGRDTDMYPQVLKVGGVDLPDPNYRVPDSAELRFQRSRRTLQDGSIPFYFVMVDTDRQLSEKAATAKLQGWMTFLSEVRARIEQLADASGGRTVFPRRVEDLLPLYQQIHRELGSGYHITYSSLTPGDGKVRRVEVRLKDPGHQVYQSRSNYYAR